jgi:hypothetical protein
MERPARRDGEPGHLMLRPGRAFRYVHALDDLGPGSVARGPARRPRATRGTTGSERVRSVRVRRPVPASDARCAPLPLPALRTAPTPRPRRRGLARERLRGTVRLRDRPCRTHRTVRASKSIIRLSSSPAGQRLRVSFRDDHGEHNQDQDRDDMDKHRRVVGVPDRCQPNGDPIDFEPVEVEPVLHRFELDTRLGDPSP